MKEAILKRNNVKVIGEGDQTILFAHGFGCDQSMWRYLTPAFKDDHRLVLFDYVGSGQSDVSAFDPERYATLHGYAQDVNEVLDALDLQDVIFIGHSVSGMIGGLAAIARPELFSQLIMIAPSPCFINHPPSYVGGFEHNDIVELLDLMEKNFTGWANFLAPMVMQNSDRPELTQELEESFCTTDPEAARVFAKATFLSDHRAMLPELKTPTLILQCSGEVIAPAEVGDYLHSQLPNSSIQLLEATGHCPHMSAPEETASAIKEYLAQLQVA